MSRVRAADCAPASFRHRDFPLELPVGKVLMHSSRTTAGGSSPAPQQLARLTTKDIVQALPADMRSALDTSIDPCDDFYHFSCGGWQKATEIPAWQSSWAKQWDGVTTFVEKATVKALEKVGFDTPGAWPS
jgi:hypothetical protein